MWPILKYLPNEIITASRTLYNNMDEKGLWDQVDPCDARIMALVTKIKQMKDTHAKAFTSDGP